MSNLTKTLVNNSMKNYHDILGNSILAYIECEKKKREIIKNKNPGNVGLDALLCMSYSDAQNTIALEILFSHLIITHLNGVTGGKTKLKGGSTKKKKTKLKKKKSLRNLSKVQKNPLENIMVFLSVFVLFSLKLQTTMAQTLLPGPSSGAFYLNDDLMELDPTNKTQMEQFTQQYGTYRNRLEQRAVHSANITDLFREDYKPDNILASLFTTISDAEFQKQVIEKTESLFNDNMYPIHKSLLKICEMTMQKSTKTTPKRLAEKFIEQHEKHKTEYENMKYKKEEEFRRQIEAEVTQQTEIEEPTLFSTFSTAAKGTVDALYDTVTNTRVTPLSEMELTNFEDRELMIQARVDEELPQLIAVFERNFEENIAKNFIENEREVLWERNRATFLENVCAQSLSIPKLNYNQSEGLIYYTDFPKNRMMVDTIVNNIIAYAKNETRQASEEDEKKILKQIEMAKYLNAILIKWDKTFTHAIQEGHHGKKSVQGFYSEIIEEVNYLKNMIDIGLTGSPDQHIKSIEDLEDARKIQDESTRKKKINNILRDVRNDQQQDTLLDQHEFINNMKQTFYHYSGINMVDSVYLDAKFWAQQEIRDWVNFILMIGGSTLLLCVMGFYARSYTPFFIRQPSRNNNNNSDDAIQTLREEYETIIRGLKEEIDTLKRNQTQRRNIHPLLLNAPQNNETASVAESIAPSIMTLDSVRAPKRIIIPFAELRGDKCPTGYTRYDTDEVCVLKKHYENYKVFSQIKKKGWIDINEEFNPVKDYIQIRKNRK